jgi:hypothetical protein
MKLFEHPDFEQAVLQAAAHFAGRGLRPAIIEKDYYVTEALRVIAAGAGDKVIFKGGTGTAITRRQPRSLAFGAGGNSVVALQELSVARSDH